MVYTYAIFSGFYCSMETSGIIRLGTRNYILRIAAVSQEHVLVCITRKVTRPENDTILVLASKLSWLMCGRSNRRNFVWGIGVDLISVLRKLTWFCVGVKNDLV